MSALGPCFRSFSLTWQSYPKKPSTGKLYSMCCLVTAVAIAMATIHCLYGRNLFSTNNVLLTSKIQTLMATTMLEGSTTTTTLTSDQTTTLPTLVMPFKIMQDVSKKTVNSVAPAEPLCIQELAETCEHSLR